MLGGFFWADFKPHYGEEKREILPIVISVGVVGFFTIFLAFCILCWRYFGTKSGRERGLNFIQIEK